MNSPDLKYIYIEKSAQLEEIIPTLSAKKAISIDLEFDKNRFRYGFNLCLMQIFDGDNTYLIDPVPEEQDISLIFPVLENPNIQKVTFSFSEDLRLLHLLGCFPKNIYDLQLASSLLNFPPGSLATLLETVMSISLTKSSQQSNWCKRPLTEKQLDYAVEDVLYLLDLHTIIQKEIENKGFEEWIVQEHSLFESENHANANHNEVLKEKYKGDMTEFEWHIFSKLMHFREELAKNADRPPYHISNRDTLQKIAEDPEYLSEWNNIASNHRSTKKENIVQELNSTLEAAIKEATELNLSTTKKASKRLSKEEYLEVKALEQKFRYAKQNIFGPIQKRIEADYGEFTKTFMLSNRLIKDIVNGNHDSLLPYKKELFLKYAEDEAIDLSNYLN